MLAILSAPSEELNQESGITKECVWGKVEDYVKRIDWGMIVAKGYSNSYEGKKEIPQVCPIWEDELGYKDVTVVCDEGVSSDVIYWLEYVHGANSVTALKEIEGGKVAIRSEYQCW